MRPCSKPKGKDILVQFPRAVNATTLTHKIPNKPKQWRKYISNLQKKANLCDFLTKLVCKREQKELAENKLLITGEGLKDVVRCVKVFY